MKARKAAPDVVRFERLGVADRAGQKPASERSIRDEANPELAADRKHRLFALAGPQRVLALKRGDRMRRVRAPDRVGTRLGETEEANLALGDQLTHRAHRLLDRHGRVDPVQIVEVDRLDAEPRETRLAARPHAQRAGIDVDRHAAGRIGKEPEFGREHDTGPPIANRSSDEMLVRAPAVRVGRIEQRDPEIEGAMYRPNRFLVVRRAVALRHAHAAETDGRHVEAARQLAGVHGRKIASLRLRRGVGGARSL